MHGAEINQFLDYGVDYVHRLDDILTGELAGTPDGATLHELIGSGGDKLTNGRPASELELVYTFAANIENLVAHGTVLQDNTVRPVRYHLAARERNRK